LVAVMKLATGAKGQQYADAEGGFDEVIDESDTWIEGQFFDANYGMLTELEEVAEAEIPFTGSSGHGDEYGPAIFACDGKKLYHLISSEQGFPYVEIEKSGAFRPTGIMQRIREFYLIEEEATNLIEKEGA
jgi:hypothetical protein